MCVGEECLFFSNLKSSRGALLGAGMLIGVIYAFHKVGKCVSERVKLKPL